MKDAPPKNRPQQGPSRATSGNQSWPENHLLPWHFPIARSDWQMVYPPVNQHTNWHIYFDELPIKHGEMSMSQTVNYSGTKILGLWRLGFLWL